MLGALDQLDGLHTVVVEQDDRPRVEARRLPSSCRLLFEPATGPFNKSRGFNAGFRSSASEVLVFSDADFLVPSRHMEAAVTACAGGIEVVRPWGDVVDLTEEETESVVARDTDPAAIGHPSRRGRLRVGESPPLCGGAYVIRREVYERLGGQDERFRGWGGEDDAMSIKVTRLCSRVGVIRDGLAFHLCHPRHSALPLDDPDYRANVALLGEYSTATMDELNGMCRTQRHTLTCR